MATAIALTTTANAMNAFGLPRTIGYAVHVTARSLSASAIGEPMTIATTKATTPATAPIAT